MSTLFKNTNAVKAIAGFVGLVIGVTFAASSAAAATYTFATNLKMGASSTDVMNLQTVLNTSADTQVSTSGAGSPGNETNYFGAKTKAAVIKFQNKYASDILAPVGLTSGTGYVGASTRAKLNTMGGGTGTVVSTVPGCTSTTGYSPTTGQACSGSTTTTGGTTAAGTLTVSTTVQPANGLTVGGASRVPFTKFVVTAGASDVVVTGVTVTRTGLAQDAVFTGVVLLDQDGTQIGTSKTFNSNHQAVIGDTFTVKAGTSRTLTVAGNMTTLAAMAAYAGQLASIDVTGISTTATVAGSFPITGAALVTNATLTIGSVSTSTSSFDPGAAQPKNIGDTGIKFSGVRFTAGSGEDLKLYSVRWRQVGSVSSSDIANVMTNASGADYPMTVDATGKYYTANFPGGITIAKGNSIDVYVKGDLAGSGSAGRTADFDIDKVTDVYFVGQLYGYGIAPSGTYTPWYNGNVFTINAGSATSIGKATEVAAQNIAVNLANQPLGGFFTDFKGEAVSITSLPITIATSSTGAGLLTSISLYNENGAVVAGPVDATGAGTSVTFTDTITFPTGRHVYTIKGKIPSGFTTNGTVIVTTVPSGWGSPTGQTSGNSVTISQGTFDMNTMTVRSGAMNIALSTTPSSQSIVSSGQGVLFANIQLDASQSGEDVRISAIPFRTSSNTGLSSCQLFDGTTALNTGSNVPTSYSTSAANTLTLDNSLTVTKGTVKTLALKCNLSGGSSTYIASLNASDTYTVTGLTSGSTITSTFGNLTSGTMTVTTAALVVSTDASSPSYTIAAAGSTGVTLGVAKFTASVEAVNLTRIGLTLGTVTASSSAADLTQVTLWNGATQIGTATFAGTSRNATSTLATALLVPKDGSVTITIKGDLATQGVSQPSHPGALLTVDVETNGANGNKNTSGTGFNSGTTINPSGSTSVAGVRVFRSFPTVARSTTGMSTGAGSLVGQSGEDLYRFTIGANAAGDIALSQLTINIATTSSSGVTTLSTTTVTNLKVYAYTGSDFATGPVAGYTAGQVVATIPTLVSNGNNTATLSSVLTIPAGQTYYFRVVGDVTYTAGTVSLAGSVTTKLSGDTAYPIHSGLMGTSTGVISGFGNTGLFIWSPMSTSTTASNNNVDWTNSFNVAGISSGSTDSWTKSK